jgi:hypothetical protein
MLPFSPSKGRKPSLKLLSRAGLIVAVLGTKACWLGFDRYPEGDVCQASRDAGIDPKTAHDPVLRGCDAGQVRRDASAEPSDSSAGSAGMAGSE